MKIAVAATDNNLESPVDPRFGRCPWFIIVDADTLEFEAVENPGVSAGGGAGVQAAQMVASKGAQAVVAGNFGPNAHQALSAADIQLYPFVGGTVKGAVEAVKEGKLSPINDATVPSHFGTGGGGAGQGRGSGSGRSG